MSLEDIRTEITAIAESVTGIGNVIYGIVFLRNEAELDMVTNNDIINTLAFLELTADPDAQEEFDLELIERRWFFLLYYEKSEPQLNQVTVNTFLVTADLKEDIMNAFNSNEDLNGTVVGHTKMRFIDNVLVTSFTHKFVHFLFFEMNTYENQEQN